MQPSQQHLASAKALSPDSPAIRPPGLLHRLAAESGFRFNGSDPWDIAVTDRRFYRRVAVQGSLGFGEAYMDGWWECERLDQLFHRLLSIDADRRIERWLNLRRLGATARRLLVNPQSRRHAFVPGEHHYDIGNDVFEAMLDPTMSYSCGYWQRARTLDEAQHDKLDLICRKLELKPGERLLDIGCGWGGLARFAAGHYGVEVVGITVSREQQKFAAARCAGLPVRIELIDYRDLAGRFDKVVSVGMFEHVGPRNHAAFFAVIDRVLEDEGLLLVHTIGNHVTSRAVDPWVDKYVFPNGHLPSASEIARAVEGRFLIEDWHNFGPDYDRTLMAWWENFERAWPALRGKYGERFYRMWKYYLLSCAGFFRARQGQLWQVVMSKRARTAMYRSVR
ncbi:MAG TPA: cyclopropane fatty acyl phospholipid synthase [Azonexus sp.]|nr:cyclopropane fatty acyl phospholipid synthase [Azonexus sp.]